MLDHPEVGLPGIELEYNFRIVFGDLMPAPYEQHQCPGIVVFSFLYSTLHSILSWNTENFKDIIEFRNMFFQKRYAEEIEYNSQYDATSTLNPRHFSGCCTYDNKVYKIHVHDIEWTGRMNREVISDI